MEGLRNNSLPNRDVAMALAVEDSYTEIQLKEERRERNKKPGEPLQAALLGQVLQLLTTARKSS